MSKKMLYILNVANRVNNFSYTSMIAAQSLDFEYHIAGNWGYKNDDERRADEEKYGIHIHQIDFIRTPYHPGNIKAYKQLARIVEKERFDVIHCNTPIGGIVGRLLGKQFKTPTVIYQAHGFHFYKGAPLLNWMLYYPVEKWLAHYTDVLITINSEDFELAKNKMKLRKGGKVYYVPGVGIDLSQYELPENIRENKRKELGLKETDVALISMGDLIDRKNYPVAIEAMAKAGNSNLQYYICGKGPEEDKLKKMAEDLGVKEQVHFLGFRTDIKELLKAADIFLFTSKQEGLARSLMEAMASGLPCVASKIRGNTDILNGTEDGFLCETNDVDSYAEKIDLLAKDPKMREAMGRNALISVHNFSTNDVIDELGKDYAANVRGGVALDEFYPNWAKKRIELGIPLDAFVLISVGELNANKNNKVIIEAIAKLQNENIHYCLCGVGPYEDELKEMAYQIGIAAQIHLLGYRTDVKELLHLANVYVMPSLREGLSRSIMEAMAGGLPCIVSDIRGNRDLIDNGQGGFLCKPNSVEGHVFAVNNLLISNDKRVEMGRYNIKKVKCFDEGIVTEYLEKIYMMNY